MSKWVVICALAAGLGILSAGATLRKAEFKPGGPFRLDFAAVYHNGTVTINPDSIRLLGRNGGECAGWQYDMTFAPQVTLSTGGKQFSLERMRFA